MEPTTDNVSAIIIEEMMKWRHTSTGDQRMVELANLSNRLIRYFAIFHAQPEQLDGLPGGHAVEARELSLGRRNASKRSLLTSTTGLAVPK